MFISRDQQLKILCIFAVSPFAGTETELQESFLLDPCLPLMETETGILGHLLRSTYTATYPSRGRKLTFYTTEVPTPPAWSYPSQGRKQVLDYYFALERFCLNPCGDGNLPYAALHRQSFPRLTPHGDGNNQCGIYFLLDNVYVLPLILRPLFFMQIEHLPVLFDGEAA